MQIIRLLVQIIMVINTSRSWEYCKSDIQSRLCGNYTHYVCESTNSITEPSNVSKEFLAHVPLTRKVKASFLNWHNYYRNRVAGGWAKNKVNKYFPKAVRMRELIWDSELSYLSHIRAKLVCDGAVTCRSTQRFPFVAQNLSLKPKCDLSLQNVSKLIPCISLLFDLKCNAEGAEEVVEALNNNTKPVLEIIALSLKKMFETKNFITDPEGMPKKYLESHKESNQFVTMVNDRISRLGCAVTLGADCGQIEFSQKFCYYTACTYDEDNYDYIYKIGEPTGRCSRWEIGRSKTYKYLCANFGKIFRREN